jgi:hypothetical protein
MEHEASFLFSQEPATGHYPIHTIWPYFFKIHFYIFLPSTPTYFEWSLSFRLSDKNAVGMRATCPAHLILLICLS